MVCFLPREGGWIAALRRHLGGFRRGARGAIWVGRRPSADGVVFDVSGCGIYFFLSPFSLQPNAACAVIVREREHTCRGSCIYAHAFMEYKALSMEHNTKKKYSVEEEERLTAI